MVRTGKKTVGVSGRTPGKHDLLNKLLGKQVGAAKNLFIDGSLMQPPFVMIDLCAGDGHDTLESGRCSPGIIVKHANFLRNIFGQDAAIPILIEKDPATFEQLIQNYGHQSFVIHGDAKSTVVRHEVERILHPHALGDSPIFLQNDPNHVDAWSILPWHLSLSKYTTTYSTLGCNVGGLKVMNFSQRQQWARKVATLIRQVDSSACRLNCCLTALVKDASQWAYMMSVPSVWRIDTNEAIKSSFGYWPTGYDLAWMSNRDDFVTIIDRLFLTAKERENGFTFGGSLWE